MRAFSFRLLLVLLMLTSLVAPTLAQQKDAASGPKLKVGDTAPDFTLKDQSGKNISLHDFQGKKGVVLAFYVFAFSGG